MEEGLPDGEEIPNAEILYNILKNKFIRAEGYAPHNKKKNNVSNTAEIPA